MMEDAKITDGIVEKINRLGKNIQVFKDTEKTKAFLIDDGVLYGSCLLKILTKVELYDVR